MATKIVEKIIKIGQKPVVVLSLEDWEDLKDKLEELEILSSQFLRNKVKKARSEKKIYTSAQVKKMLKL